VYYTDLQKLAAGDADAERAVIGENQVLCQEGWIIERNRRSLVCFRFLTHLADRNGYGLPNCIAVYDPLANELQGFLELPPLHWAISPVPVLPNTFYYFDIQQANSKEPDFAETDFYVINL